MVHLASALPDSLAWLANLPDVLIILLCCAGACLAAFPVARATGLVGVLGSRERKLTARLNVLAEACSALASTAGKPASARTNIVVSGQFRGPFQLLAGVIERGLSPRETHSAAATELDQWVTSRASQRSTLLTVCQAGPALALGAALGAIVLMAEVWANPAALSSGAAMGIGLSVVGCVLALAVLSSGAMWLEEAERADLLAAGVVLDSAQTIAAGGSSEEVSRRTAILLRPRTTALELQPVRKAA